MSGTDLAYGPTSLQAMSGTELAYGPTLSRGTDLSCAATLSRGTDLAYAATLSRGTDLAYAATLSRGTDLAYAATLSRGTDLAYAAIQQSLTDTPPPIPSASSLSPSALLCLSTCLQPQSAKRPTAFKLQQRMVIRPRYAMCGTDIAYGDSMRSFKTARNKVSFAISLRARYAMSGTDIARGAMRCP
eukprot:3941274-Rhodomonas_salina.1